MKINTKLLINIFLPIGITLLVLLVIASAIATRNEADRKNRAVLSLLWDMSRLNERTYSYLLSREARTRNEWLRSYDAVAERTGSLRFDNAEQDRILEGIRHNLAEMKSVFSERLAKAGAGGTARRATEQLSGEILIRTRSIASDAFRLYELSTAEARGRAARSNTLILLLLASSVLVSLSTLLPMNRSLSRSVAMLTAGAAAVGSGDLDHKIGLATDDEIGELSAAFDRMTDNLKNLTVRRDELAREMTERKQAETALRISEENYRAIFNSATDAILVHDVATGDILDVNDTMLQLYGYTREEVRALSVEDLSAEDGGGGRQDARQAIRKVAETDTPRVFEWQARDKAGRTFWVEVSIKRVPLGGRDRLLAVVRDIDRRKKSEENIRKQASVIDLAYDAIFLRRLDDRITFWNQGSVMLYGWNAGEAQDRQPQDLLKTVFPRPLEELRGELLRTGLWEGELEQTRVDGRRIIVESRWALLRDGGGNPQEILEVNRDVTERRQAEDDLRLLVGELERSNRELEQFAYVASHDLQEPLRMVASYVQLLERRYRGRLDDKADRFIFFAVDGVKRMQKLIDGLLAYSRVSRGARFQRVDMNTAFAQAVVSLAIAIRESGADVDRGQLPPVTGDETQLQQLLQNLIGNAIKYRKPNVAPRIGVAARRSGREWVFSVSDNGIGIEPQFFDRIFQLFQRLHSRDEYPGTGLGLSLCKRIVERHGGRIWVESEPGTGTTFFFTIPDRGPK